MIAADVVMAGYVVGVCAAKELSGPRFWIPSPDALDASC